MTSILELSHWQCWPEPGGFDDQASTLVEDVMTLLSLRRALKDGRVRVAIVEPLDKSIVKMKNPMGGS